MLYFAITLVAIALVLEIVGLVVVEPGNVPKGGVRAGAVVVLAVHRIKELLFSDSRSDRKRYYDEVFVGEGIDDRLPPSEVKNASYGIYIIALSSGLYIAAALSGAFGGHYITSLQRPDKGEKDYRILAEYEDSEVMVDLKVPSRELTKKEINDTFNDVKSKLKKYIMADNEDARIINSDLRFDSDIGGSGVKAYYGTSAPEVISNTGRVYSENLPREEKVTIFVHLSFYELKEDLSYEFIVVPFSEYSHKRAILEEEIERAFLDERYEESVNLPDEVRGEEIKYRVNRTDNAYVIVFLGLIAALLFVPYGVEQRKTLRKKRNTELVVDYPELVSKLALLLEAGLTVRGAFERIAGDYEKKRAKKAGKKTGKYKRYVYEEMIRTRNEIALGIAEQEAYARFGRRCGNMYYIRLSALLSQNVKRGGESLIISLKQEVREANKEKSAQTKKKGEEIGMKLLIPMMGEFALVMAIILIPAMLTM